MSDRKADTIDLGKNVQYAKVATRVAEFHRDNEKCNVETSCKIVENHIIFTAMVTTSKGVFTGHSMDKVSGKQKQFEKQETIAVGRALAFAGYLASGDIACAEEMADVVTAAQLNSLKLKYAKLHETELEGLDRIEKQDYFHEWCGLVVGEEINTSDASAWCREWYLQCWNELQDISDEVPFEE